MKRYADFRKVQTKSWSKLKAEVSAGSVSWTTEAAIRWRGRRTLLKAGASGGTPFLDLSDGVLHRVEHEERGGVPGLIVPHDFEDGEIAPAA